MDSPTLSLTTRELLHDQTNCRGLSLHYDSEHHVLVSFTVKNTGERVGVAIPQVYVVSSIGEIKLGGFSNRFIEPGQEVEVGVQLTVRPDVTWLTTARVIFGVRCYDEPMDHFQGSVRDQSWRVGR